MGVATIRKDGRDPYVSIALNYSGSTLNLLPTSERGRCDVSLVDRPGPCRGAPRQGTNFASEERRSACARPRVSESWRLADHHPLSTDRTLEGRKMATPVTRPWSFGLLNSVT